MIQLISALIFVFSLASGNQSKAQNAPTTPSERTSPQENIEQNQIAAMGFDVDDNLLNLRTKIWLFEKSSDQTIGLATHEFALIREVIGDQETQGVEKVLAKNDTEKDYLDHVFLPILNQFGITKENWTQKWNQWELRTGDIVHGSYRDFGDKSAEQGDKALLNAFLDAFGASVTGEHELTAKAWKAFHLAMSTISTAKDAFIITARLHEAETILLLFKKMQKVGMIRHIPDLANIWAVTAPGFEEKFRKEFNTEPPEGGAANPSLRKAAVMKQMLLRNDLVTMPKSAKHIINSKETTMKRLHSFSFSDDDAGNFLAAKNTLQATLDSGAIKQTKIALFYTGHTKDDRIPLEEIILRKNQIPRKINRDLHENIEWEVITKEKANNCRSNFMR